MDDEILELTFRLGRIKCKDDLMFLCYVSMDTLYEMDREKFFENMKQILKNLEVKKC